MTVKSNSRSSRPANKPARKQRKKIGIRLSPAEIIALLIVILCIGFMLGRFSASIGEYEGLGEPEEMPLNPYDKDGFSYSDDGRLSYEDEAYTSVQVLDVSYAQKDINWEKVAKDGIDEVIIRLGYRGYESGLLNLDVYFEQNLKGARDAGLKVGVYFFSQDRKSVV